MLPFSPLALSRPLHRPSLLFGPSGLAMASSAADWATAITYRSNGPPGQVLECRTYPLPRLNDDQVKLKLKLSPLNPADINTIQGKYPVKPKLREDLIKGEEPFYIAGNEGLGEIIEIGPKVDQDQWKIGDWVIMGKPQMGTWQSKTNVSTDQIIKLPKSNRLSEVQAATMMVNMSTAYRMIKTHFPSSESSSSGFADGWLIQNGANSDVGQYVLQFCRAWGIGCVGVVRDRPEIDQLKKYLTSLGPPDRTIILTYEELADRSKTSGLNIILGLNCVGGNEETVGLMKCMANGSSLITYGGMSMKPLMIPTSLILFRDLKLQGFMLSHWYSRTNLKDRKDLIEDLIQLIDQHQIQNRDQSISIIELKNDHHENIVKIVKEKIHESMMGKSGKKILFRFI